MISTPNCLAPRSLSSLNVICGQSNSARRIEFHRSCPYQFFPERNLLPPSQILQTAIDLFVTQLPDMSRSTIVTNISPFNPGMELWVSDDINWPPNARLMEAYQAVAYRWHRDVNAAGGERLGPVAVIDRPRRTLGTRCYMLYVFLGVIENGERVVYGSRRAYNVWQPQAFVEDAILNRGLDLAFARGANYVQIQRRRRSASIMVGFSRHSQPSQLRI